MSAQKTGQKDFTANQPNREKFAIGGMIFLAVCIFIFLTISYQLIFIAYSILSIYVLSVYLLLWLEGPKEEPQTAAPKKQPSVSILIPCYNAKETVFKTIESCRKLKYGGKMEIVVVDDGSTDGTYEMLKRVSGIKLLRNKKNQGKAAALNLGMRKTSSEIFACIDADSYPQKDVLQKAVKHFYDDSGVAAVVIFICVEKPMNLLQRIQDIEYLVSFGFFYRVISDTNALYVTPGPTSLYKRSVLQKLGGFDEKSLTEDMEIALRMQKHGYKIRACHETEVVTGVPDTIPKLFRQRLRWYRGGVMNIIKYHDLFFNTKYGDFGIFVLPTTLGSGFFAALFMAWTFIVWSGNTLKWLTPIAYDFSTGTNAVMSAFGSGVLIFNSSWILVLFSLAIWAYFLLKSFEISNTQPQPRHILPLILLLWIYPLFISFVFLVGYLQELFGVKYTW